MKDPLDRTKVVLRHLPPTISQSNLVEHIDPRFSGRYHWLSFRPGKPSPKHIMHSRAYIDFNSPEDVIEFAEFFNGHVFVNEKGAQFKAIVEYAPSQRVPKQWCKKDGREGTILKDPEYMEFLEFLATPVENLPSAEIQLERKEAERAGAPKDVPIVTPLMEYIRQKRVAKFGARRIVVNGRSSRREGGISSKGPVSSSSKRGLQKRTSTTMYVLRESSKGVGGKDKHDQHLADKSASLAKDAPEGESGGSGSTGIVKKKILLLKGKEKEISDVSGGPSLQQNSSISAQDSHSSSPFGPNQRREASGRMIRSILLNKDTRQNLPSTGSQSESRSQASNQDRDKRPPRPPSVRWFQKETNGVPEDNVVNSDLHVVGPEKQGGRTKNKDRPDRGIWAPIRRSEGSHASDDSLSSSSASQTSQMVDPIEDVKSVVLVTRGGNYRQIGSGRNSPHSVDNGSYRNGGRRGSAYNVKDTDGSSVVEGKLVKRGGSSGYGSHEKQVWVQKSSSGS